MSHASDYLESQIGTHLLRTGSWTKPTAIWVALFTVMPNEAGTGGTEVTGGSYARVQHGPSDATWTEPAANGVLENIGAVQFAAPTANWGDIIGFALYDAATVGNFLIGNAFTNAVTVANGDPAPAFGTGQLTVTVA